MVVAVPVRDEEARIGPCLLALAAQGGATPDHVVLLVNNTTDGTVARVRDMAPALPFALTVACRVYPDAQAHAGTARREAMEIAAARAGAGGILLTTDADGRVAPDWIGRTLSALAAGAQAVCGRARIDPMEALAIPAHLHRDDDREVAYATVLDRIHDLADPDPFDPWPRHTEHSGASIAVTVAAWARAGGVPALPIAEDRAFIAALRRVDTPIRHAADVRVTVSGRILGRARGGMADTIARRMERQDAVLDDSLEPAGDCLRRARARAWLRHLHDEQGIGRDTRASTASLAAMLGVPTHHVAHRMIGPYFGMCWERLEAETPSLRRRRVHRSDLAWHHARAVDIVAGLLDGPCIQDDRQVPLMSPASRSIR
ncbi:glycosyltransferase [Gluconacetobacter johannae DSM 13595]|uniref:Glycosyltransferase family 2 protein n=2 Tax=Gluconacetobacter johannae TaxID=112140 RepID=A0A7W4J7U9_9PROT|nr:glycosyltransferase family A protein [Gluconacetobacter johannae]MBB2176042.1 glycosyltransferase family 2 protein [Gluconacetobacter johannae]GBQ79876.1 glycosyltransferase [Gluconacetobacter johannae DSM 13595]